MALNDVEDGTIPVDARVIALDETRYWCGIEEQDRPHIERICGIYLYDRNLHTYLCCMTPSYWMEHLRNRVDLTEEAQATLSDDEKQALYERYEDYPAEDSGHYMDCGDIDRLERELRQEAWRYHEYGEVQIAFVDGETREDIFDAVREDMQGNHVI
jgi:hypothetical protein